MYGSVLAKKQGGDVIKVDTPFNVHVPKEIEANLRWRRAVHKRVREDPDYASVIIDACSRDPLFFLNGFGWTFDTRVEPFCKIPFLLYPFQESAIIDLIRAFNSHDILIEKTRDMGASWICLSSVYWAWRFRKDSMFLLVSRDETYVDKTGNPKTLFWKFDYLQDNLPEWLKPKGFKRSLHRHLLHIKNSENGSVVDGESTTDKVARGDRRTAIILDEFAAVERGESVLSSTMSATNCRIFNSTPLGKANAFYDMRQTTIKKIRLHWSVHPLKNVGLYTTDKNGSLKILDRDGYPEGYVPLLDGSIRSPWYDKECRRSPIKRLIAQELDIDYGGSGGQFFDASAVQGTIRKYARQPSLIGDLDYDSVTAEPLDFRESPLGRLELWCQLDKDGNPPRDHRYGIGNDISAGTGASNSCAAIWDLTTKEKVGQYVNPNVRPEDFAAQVVALARWFSFVPDVILGDIEITVRKPVGAFLVWESNGPGRQFGSRIIEFGYLNVYLRQRDEALSKKITDVPGWASTSKGKEQLLSFYRAVIEKGECVNRSKEALEETLEYVFGPDGIPMHARSENKSDPSSARANHGDRVMADALAWKGMGGQYKKPEVVEPKIPVGSLAWRNKQRAIEKENRDNDNGWKP